MLEARLTPRWRQAWPPVALIFGVFVALAIADAGMGAEKCPAQFPKWIACVVASHETLIGVGGALVAAWIAWRSIMAQIESDRAIAHQADRAYVIGGPGGRM